MERNFVLQTTIVRELHLHTFNAKFPELFVYDRGHIYRYTQTPEKIERDEFMYIHFQDRKNMPVHTGCEDCFLITHLGFYPFDEKKMEQYFVLYGGFDSPSEKRMYLLDVRKRQNKGRLKKLKREFLCCGFRAFYNIYQRYKGVLWLKKNNMF